MLVKLCGLKLSELNRSTRLSALADSCIRTNINIYNTLFNFALYSHSLPKPLSHRWQQSPNLMDLHRFSFLVSRWYSVYWIVALCEHECVIQRLGYTVWWVITFVLFLFHQEHSSSCRSPFPTNAPTFLSEDEGNDNHNIFQTYFTVNRQLRTGLNQHSSSIRISPVWWIRMTQYYWLSISSTEVIVSCEILPQI